MKSNRETKLSLAQFHPERWDRRLDSKGPIREIAMEKKKEGDLRVPLRDQTKVISVKTKIGEEWRKLTLDRGRLEASLKLGRKSM